MRHIDNIASKQNKKKFINIINGIKGVKTYKVHGNYKSPKYHLEKLKDEYNNKTIEYHIINFIHRRFDKIILLNPLCMEKWIRRVEKSFPNLFYTKDIKGEYANQTIFGEKLTKALSYENLQKKVLKEFFFDTNHNNTCVYCNAQYTISYDNIESRALMFQIDHIFPKKKYPYFSISLFNLVPSCANCNLNKGSKDFWPDDYFHPYIESMSDNFKFTIGQQDKDSLFNHPNEISDFEKVKITITNKSNPKIRNHNELFDLEGIYNNFNDIAQEIIELGKLHPASKRNSYLDDLEGEEGKLFPDKETLERIYLRVYPNPEDINKRPLSKFIQDIARFSDFYDDKF